VAIRFCLLFLLSVCACTMTQARPRIDEELLEETLALVKEVKEFGRSLGIEPTKALSQSSNLKPTKSMLWLWLQYKGTLAIRTPIDIRVAVRFSAPQERVPIEHLYNISGYSVYFRQGNEFGDVEAVTTGDFAKKSLFRRVMTVLHEDLHGDQNFALPWENEESIVTPLAMIATLQFLKYKGDEPGIKEAESVIKEEAQLSRELMDLAQQAQELFRTETVNEAKRKLLKIIASSGVYGRHYSYQMKNQDENVGMEAKVSHDLAYYRHFERILSLHSATGDLKTLIGELKNIPRDTDMEGLEKYLGDLERR
jgi:hypothetical protein